MTNPVQHWNWFSVIRRAVVGTSLLLFVLVLAVMPIKSAQAQTLTVLHSFTGGSDGVGPRAGLVRDAAGNLYGTTGEGGGSGCSPYGCGTVFTVDTSGKEIVLYGFKGASDGAGPSAGLVRDGAGNLYGTTNAGGGVGCLQGQGCGTVFKVDTSGKETVLHRFSEGFDGSTPLSTLVLDAAGNLYGTTSGNEGGGNATVFRLNNTGTLTVLHSFTGGSDGGGPQAGLLRDSAGSLYGTAQDGGVKACFDILTSRYAYCGLVFKVDSTGKETVLHAFSGGDGRFPQAALIKDAAGNLYGTTAQGGGSSCPTGTRYGPGCGTVFKLSTTGNLTVLHSFTGGTGGATPVAGVIRDAAGNLYGTTSAGGGGTGCSGGCGTVFKLDATGKETVLHSFTGGTADGANPRADLVLDASGNLYGTTVGGGVSNRGIVFKLTPTMGADLSLTSSPSPNPVAHGANLTYTYAVTNKGPDNSDGDTLTTTIPSGTTFQGFSITAGTCSHPPLNGTGTFTCLRGSLLLAAHSWGPITLTVKINAASGTTVINTSKVAAKTQDVNSANNTATVSVNVH